MQIRRTKPDITVNSIISAPIDSIKGVGPKRSLLLSGMGLNTVEDLLWFFPRKYVDRRNVVEIEKLLPGCPSVIFANVDSVERRRLQKPGLELVVCRLSDKTGNLTAFWFNRKGIEYVLKKGTPVALYGVPSLRGTAIEMSNPEFEVLKDESDKGTFIGIVPVYPVTAGIQARWFRHLIEDVLANNLPFVGETLPESVLKKRHLLSISDALSEMHRPRSEEAWKEARRRFVYEEFLLVQTGMMLRRRSLKECRTVSPVTPDGVFYEKFRASLPFDLTDSQKHVLDEIFSDIAQCYPMSRLLQGDVGSGKTLVAIALAAAGADMGVQTAIMAPTEVLADQLYSQTEKWLSGIGISSVILKGGQSSSARLAVLNSVRDGSALIVVGTQAIIENSVIFNNLGIVIIDEQQRFGVMQRAVMLNRNPMPHLLLMSATPIPRTLALCLFGDLDISTLREKPEGHGKIETRIIDFKKIKTLLQFIADEARSGGLVYWICPRVEEDGAMESASVEKRYSFIKRHLGVLGVGSLHGRMESSEKELVLQRFRESEIKILVSTTVVEVGVDVPEASLIVIESPECFGLSQLHQLRGRVGRGKRRGVCVLLVKNLAEKIPERLGVLLNTDDGFEIAEADLLFRGSGEISGLSQHGITEFKLADLHKDVKLLLEAKDDALELAGWDEMSSENPIFVKKIKSVVGDALGIG